MDLRKHKNDLLFVPLGGCNEIGMNLNLYHYKGKWLMIDLGIGFADDYLPGVDIIIPDMQFIVQRKKDLVGLVLTHAHEDHIGAIPYLWEELECPMYATKFTAELIKAKMNERGKLKGLPLHVVDFDETIDLNPFSVELIGVTHSIPEMQALAIRTDKGTIMHTGDWKFDPEPLVGEPSNLKRLKEIGDEGVLAVVCDSTNVFVDGESGSEAMVRKNLSKLIKSCKERVAITTFASNIARLETVIMAGVDAGRKISLAGRSLTRLIGAAQSSGYLQDIPEFIDDRSAMSLPRKEVMIICTGSQGEAMAATAKIAGKNHPWVRLVPGDSFIFSSRVIPGNEKKIGWVQNQLVGQGIEVLTDHRNNIHVSGHPARGELKQMYETLRPKIAVPVHGETRHIHEHAKFAKSIKVPFAIEPQNGSVILLSDDKPQILGMVDSGYYAVDGDSLIPTDGEVMRVRRKIKNNGVVLATIITDGSGELAAKPRISAPGSLDIVEDSDIIESIQLAIAEEYEKKAGQSRRKGLGDKDIINMCRSVCRKIFGAELDKRPLIEVHLIRV
jgi:ribonuclease J